MSGEVGAALGDGRSGGCGPLAARSVITIMSGAAGRGCSSMAEQKLPKLQTGVRFPSPAPIKPQL